MKKKLIISTLLPVHFEKNLESLEKKYFFVSLAPF